MVNPFVIETANESIDNPIAISTIERVPINAKITKDIVRGEVSII